MPAETPKRYFVVVDNRDGHRVIVHVHGEELHIERLVRVYVAECALLAVILQLCVLRKDAPEVPRVVRGDVVLSDGPAAQAVNQAILISSGQMWHSGRPEQVVLFIRLLRPQKGAHAYGPIEYVAQVQDVSLYIRILHIYPRHVVYRRREVRLRLRVEAVREPRAGGWVLHARLVDVRRQAVL